MEIVLWSSLLLFSLLLSFCLALLLLLLHRSSCGQLRNVQQRFGGVYSLVSVSLQRRHELRHQAWFVTFCR